MSEVRIPVEGEEAEGSLLASTSREPESASRGSEGASRGSEGVRGSCKEKAKAVGATLLISTLMYMAGYVITHDPIGPLFISAPVCVALIFKILAPT